MVMTRTPLRVSFIGGGTDLPAFYNTHPTGGAVVSAAISKYVYVTVSRKFDFDVRLSYSRTENVVRASELQHPIVRACLDLLGIENRVEITTVADVPAGTGLGSSSSFTVGLLNALHQFKYKIAATPEWLATMACRIEIEELGEPIGAQDQYIAAYGGIKYFKFYEHNVNVMTVYVDPEFFNNQCVLIYTGRTRLASTILAEQSKISRRNKRLAEMRKLVPEFVIAAQMDRIQEVGSLVNAGWALKRSLVKKISSSSIDDLISSWNGRPGVFGAKLLGAGGEGFVLVLMEAREKQKLPTEWSTNPEANRQHIFDVKFGVAGSEVVFNDEPARV